MSEVSGTKKLADCSPQEAKDYFLKGSTYFNSDLPTYFGFDSFLSELDSLLAGRTYKQIMASDPALLDGVNYKLLTNKDGRFAWRQYELIHPVLYVSLANTICSKENWPFIVSRLNSFHSGRVTCCSSPVVSTDVQSDKAAQIKSWWHQMEQETLKQSLSFSRMISTDVTDCYGSIYTHSIAWALHTKKTAKDSKGDLKLVGNFIDKHIQISRFGQTNGIPQGSGFMDFIAELVLGYCDDRISEALAAKADIAILRYRDDYRILANSDRDTEEVLMAVSAALRDLGMRLGTSKTYVAENVVENALKPDKIAGLAYEDFKGLDEVSLQKKILSLHSFGRRFPNSGALRRLVSRLQDAIIAQEKEPFDLDVQIAVLTDIACTSPVTFPVIASILSRLISLKGSSEVRKEVWKQVEQKIRTVPNNGYLDIWLQRVTIPEKIGLSFDSNEKLCGIANGS
ncbi:MAG: RNA-directed DNA polymerase, partial [Tabrizicola sp.]|nr:RNA-directed DNA polymerase [Tabrizicola sp.]